VEISILDCRGARCPLPIIKSAAFLQGKNSGFTFQLLSDDPATEPDLIAWSRMTGNPSKKISEATFEITKASQ
jgi:tRNA 2-thiouridine synthesizing protein A